MSAKKIQLEIVKGGQESTATVAVLGLDAPQMAAAIKADVAVFDRMSKEAVFIALRIGLRLVWIRDNGAYGSLTKFVKAHFAGKSERTLYNYIGLADQFLTESGLRDKATHKLTGKALETAAPIVEEQLELFTDATAKHVGAVKKMVAWVGKRGLSEIYKSLEKPRGVTNKNPPVNAGGNDGDELDLETLIEQAKADYIAVESAHTAKTWHHLDDEGLAALSRILDAWQGELKALELARRGGEVVEPGQVSKVKPNKKKGGAE